MIGALFWQILELPISYIMSTQRTEQIQQLQQLLQNQNLPAEILQFVEGYWGTHSILFSDGGLVFKAFACGISPRSVAYGHCVLGQAEDNRTEWSSQFLFSRSDK
jgi:hypothetical protein